MCILCFFLDISLVGSYTVSSLLQLLTRMLLEESVSTFLIQLVHVLIYCTTAHGWLILLNHGTGKSLLR